MQIQKLRPEAGSDFPKVRREPGLGWTRPTVVPGVGDRCSADEVAGIRQVSAPTAHAGVLRGGDRLTDGSR